MPAAPSDVASAAAMAEIRSGGANRDGPAPSRLDLACLDGANTHRPCAMFGGTALGEQPNECLVHRKLERRTDKRN
ncbi:hypothetical protein [Vibrio europaeus]|uniref:hypothetical protein n=1 Tax=Vibrio europaeus TaxID=300876 RepID=UPI0020A636CB|nr:hypothetical protein [Vibrio europaeus]